MYSIVSAQPGDTVSVQLFPGGRHEGIVDREGFIIARSRRFGGITRVAPSVFSGGRLRHNHGYIGVLSRHETLARAEARIGEPGYDVLTRNCIHFVNEVNGLPRTARLDETLTSLPRLHDIARLLTRRRLW